MPDTQINIFLEIGFKVLGFLALLIVAIIVALIARAIVKRLLSIKKIEYYLQKIDHNLTPEEREKASKMNINGDLSLKNVFSEFTFWIVLILFSIPALNMIGFTSASEIVNDILTSILDFIPKLILALLVVFVGIVLANFVKKITYILFLKFKLQELIAKITFNEGRTLKFDLGQIIAWILYGFVILLFAAQAIDILNLPVLTGVFVWLIGYVPSVLGTLIILIITYILGEFVKGLLENSLPEMKIIALAAKYVIWVLGAIVALNQLNLAVSVINSVLVVVLLSIGVSLSIAFGVGGISTAKKIIKKKYEEFEN